MLSTALSKQVDVEPLVRSLKAAMEGRPLEPRAAAVLPQQIRSLLAEMAERMAEERNSDRARAIMASVSGECRETGQALHAISQTQHDTEQQEAASLKRLEDGQRLAFEQVQHVSMFIEMMASSLLGLDAAVGRAGGNLTDIEQFIDESTSHMAELAAAFTEINGQMDDCSARAAESGVTAEHLGAGSQTIVEQVRGAGRSLDRIRQEIDERASEAGPRTHRHLEAVRDGVDQSLSVIETLRTRSGAIGKIIVVIESITKQTNLLALNAAILAAQSGAEGKSFSVVADEIRVLADRTARSAKEIATVITSVQEGADQAVETIQQCRTHIDQGLQQSMYAHQPLTLLAQQVKHADDMIASIGCAMEEHTKGIQLFGQAIEQMTSTVQFVQRVSSHHQGVAKRIVDLADQVRHGIGQLNLFKEDHLREVRRLREVVEPMLDRNQMVRGTLEDCRAHVVQLQHHHTRLTHQAAHMAALSGTVRQAGATLQMTAARWGANGDSPSLEKGDAAS